MKTLAEVLEKKKENQNSEQNSNSSNDDEEIEKFTISEFTEDINGFETYKLTIGDSNSYQIWFTKTSFEPSFVKKIKEEVNKFENNWFDFSVDLSKYGIEDNVVIVKFISRDDNGSFNFDLNTHKKINAFPDEFKIPENFKKVRKL